MRPPINSRQINNNTDISECYPCGEHKRGYWLYDKIQGMNLAMGAETEVKALEEALTYYQERYIKMEKELEEIKGKVNSFIASFREEEEE